MYYIILHPKRHQVGHSNKEIRQPKHQVHHLNEKNIPTKTPSTPSNFKRIHQPNHHIRHLNQKNTPNKTPSTSSQLNEYTRLNSDSNLHKLNILCALSFITLCTYYRETTHLSGGVYSKHLHIRRHLDNETLNLSLRVMQCLSWAPRKLLLLTHHIAQERTLGQN